MNDRDRREGGQAGLGILSTLKDALDEVLAEAREKGGTGADRARDAVRGTMARARDLAGERLDFVTHQELQDVRNALDELKVRLENLERRTAQDPMAGPSRPDSGGAAAAGTGASSPSGSGPGTPGGSPMGV